MTIKQVLKQCQVFSALSDAELEKVERSVEEKEYEPGATIFSAEETAEEVLVLQEGRVALQMVVPAVHERPSRKVTVDIVGPNELVGWSAVVEPYIYDFSAVCLHKTRVLSILGGRLRRLLQEDHEIGYQLFRELIKVVASRLDETRHVLASERLLTVQRE